ncbi:hypothetical protein ACFSB1_10685 [Halopseudomonas phragmitis]|uniref:Uncharacterized protein n=1 Tax=Halopseudomonas phragmitis TaxID=1931241 RepID=A0A1V0B9I8_9GAMM|nr:hypothetical protein [Halopseudomonas phragmitis]AQZ96550.1 hypothetical protein BVH74_18130 [Halopseudomonas phragmitis]
MTQSANNQRQGQRLLSDLAGLIPPAREPRQLRQEEPRGAIPGRRGQAEVNLQPGTGEGGGAGIASPLTEVSRTYSAEPVFLPTIDGSGYFRVRKIDSMTVLDAEGREIVINFAEAGNL